MRFILELYLGKLFAFLTDRIDKNRGTSFAGYCILKLDRKFISKFKGIHKDQVILVSGTNGKSTTTHLIVHILKHNGHKVISNVSGANLASGIATCLIKNSDCHGRVKEGYLVLEVDERTLKYILDWIPAKHLLITNIMTDQVARNGYPEFIYNIFSDIIQKDMTLYLNNDDPRSKAFESLGTEVVYYGCERMNFNKQKQSLFDITMPCPKCHHKITFEYMNGSNIGHFYCSNCGYSNQKKIKYCVKSIDFKKGSAEILDTKFKLPYTASFMIYNYAAAISLTHHLGNSIHTIVDAFQNFRNIEGRIETFQFNQKKIFYLRMKQENPETLQAAIDVVIRDKHKKAVVIGLCVIDDFIPFYSNTFYSFDCQFDGLKAETVEKIICFGETICYDVANRLIYDGIPLNKIEMIPSNDGNQILTSIAQCQSTHVYLITWLKIYHQILSSVPSC